MAKLVDITFNTNKDERFANQVSGGVAVTNNRVELDSSEFFDGDACGRWDGNPLTNLSLASSADFNIGDGNTLYIQIKFQPVALGRYGLISRRQSVNDRWHVIIDLETEELIFFGNNAGTEVYNETHDLSSITGLEIKQGRWYVYEFACDGTDAEVRHFINGLHVGTSAIPTGTVTVVPAAPVLIGYANEDDTGGSAIDRTFDRYMDSIVFDDALPTGYDTDDDKAVRTWTGGVELLEEFDPPIVPQPIINDPSAFPNNIPDFAKANNQLYIAGIDPMKKVQGTASADVGLAAPAQPTLNNTTGDKYDYVTTWLDADLNESPASPVSDDTDATGAQVTVAASAAAVPDNAEFYRVYRRDKDAGQGFHYLIADKQPVSGLIYTDNTATVVASLFTTAPRQSIDVPPAANHIAYNRNRLFYANVQLENDDKFPTRMYWSQVNELEQVDVNDWAFIGASDDDYITGMVSFLEQILVFKEKSMWLVIGDPDTPDFQIRNLSRSVGCVAHQTIVEVDGTLMWLGDEGVYAWRGQDRPDLISDPIEPVFENMPDLRKAFATASVDEEVGLYLLSISESSETENDAIYCYNYRESFDDGVHRWSKWTDKVTSLGRAYLGTGRNPRIIFYDSKGKLGIYEKGLDLNSGINVKYQSTRINPYNPGSFMRVHYMTMMCDLEAEGLRYLDIGFQSDKRNPVLTNFREPTSNNFKIAVQDRAEFISFILEGVDIRRRFRVYGYSVQGNGVGHR